MRIKPINWRNDDKHAAISISIMIRPLWWQFIQTHSRAYHYFRKSHLWAIQPLDWCRPTHYALSTECVWIMLRVYHKRLFLANVSISYTMDVTFRPDDAVSRTTNHSPQSFFYRRKYGNYYLQMKSCANKLSNISQSKQVLRSNRLFIDDSTEIKAFYLKKNINSYF